jgi:hypothetical protein
LSNEPQRVRSPVIDEMAQQVPLVRFRRMTLVTAGELTGAGLRLVACGLAACPGTGCGKGDFDVQAAAGLRADGEGGGVGLGDWLDEGQP